TFKPGVNLNFAQVLVQNRINLALPLLPDVVKQAGVTTRKRNPDILQVIAVYSPHDRYDQLYLSNYVTIKLKDEIARVDGVEDVVLRAEPDGRKVRIKDVGRAVLGARNLDTTSKVDGRPNASLAVFALSDANALATAQRVIARMDELKKSFPEDLDYLVSLDMTPFIRESIYEVICTLVEAVALDALVVLLFLQNWRSAIIPLVAVPVAIVGTFAAMAAIGFSLNNLTLFGLVLA